MRSYTQWEQSGFEKVILRREGFVGCEHAGDIQQFGRKAFPTVGVQYTKATIVLKYFGKMSLEVLFVRYI